MIRHLHKTISFPGRFICFEFRAFCSLFNNELGESAYYIRTFRRNNDAVLPVGEIRLPTPTPVIIPTISFIVTVYE